MLIGESNQFAIESEINVAYENLGQRALGFFVLILNGRLYGVRDREATLMACSFDEVRKRISRRGRHVISFPVAANAVSIVDAFRRVFFGSESENYQILGMSNEQLSEAFITGQIQWAPDGDEAFDDGSYVLHFDEGDRVRLIAFKSGNGVSADASSISEVWLNAQDFYSLLEKWCDRFESEWRSLPKS